MTEVTKNHRTDADLGHSLLFKDISKSVVYGNNMSKQVLSMISGQVNPGEMLALMGPSGSGKTSLLQILGGRSLIGVSGEVRIGDRPYQRKTMRHKIAYILQDDIFMFSYILTIRDHLNFAASMKLPEALNGAEKYQKVSKIIHDLGLDHCADSPLLLVSGGERKRTSIGMEILADPALLLMDEGTSGLDSTAASSLIQIIRNLANKLSIPVVQAIHQPSTSLFYSFDSVLLLSYGSVAYFGSPNNCMQYFNSLGFSPPHGHNVNPADFALELLYENQVNINLSPSQEHTIAENDLRLPREVLVDSYRNAHLQASSAQFSSTSAVQDYEDKENQKAIQKDFSIRSFRYSNGSYPSNYRTQFYGLFLRAIRSAKSSRLGYLNVSETIILALLVGACWFQTPSDELHLLDLTGYLFLSMLYWFFVGLFQGLLEFLPERACLKKEREAGMYHLSAYFIAKTCASAPMRMTLPGLYILISYPLAVENVEPAAIFGLGAVIILVTFVGESLGLFIGTLTIKEDVAVSTATLVALGMMLMGGFYVEISHIPQFLRWLRYTSAFLYGYQSSVAIQVLLGGRIRCQGGYKIYACSLLFTDEYLPQEDALIWLGVNETTIGLKIGVLVCMFIVLRLAAYFTLRFAPHNIGRS